jgi:hypothetical protein
MTLGAGALARPLRIDAAQLHVPLLLMLAALVPVIALAWPNRHLGRRAGLLCLVLCPVFLVVALAV